MGLFKSRKSWLESERERENKRQRELQGKTVTVIAGHSEGLGSNIIPIPKGGQLLETNSLTMPFILVGSCSEDNRSWVEGYSTWR